MPRPSDLRKLAVWRERFERFSSSGLAAGPFCAREGVSTASFYTWRKKLSLNGRSRSATEGRPRLRTGPAERRGRFQQVALIPGTSPVPATAPATCLPAGMVCIQLPCGTRIEVSAEDLDVLRAVIAEVVRADGGLEGVMPTFGRQMMRAPCGWTIGRADCGRGVGTASC